MRTKKYRADQTSRLETHLQLSRRRHDQARTTGSNLWCLVNTSQSLHQPLSICHRLFPTKFWQKLTHSLEPSGGWLGPDCVVYLGLEQIVILGQHKSPSSFVHTHRRLHVCNPLGKAYRGASELSCVQKREQRSQSTVRVVRTSTPCRLLCLTSNDPSDFECFTFWHYT